MEQRRYLLGICKDMFISLKKKKKKEEKKITVTRTYYMKGNVYVGTGNAQGKVLALRSRM